MATFRLVPSTYEVSSTYLSVSSADSMYTDTDSTSYGTVTNTRSGTTTYYIYLRGFDFDSLPAGAVVNSFTVKLKASESRVNTSTSYSPKLCHGTSQITSTCSAITTTASVHDFTDVSATWEDIVSYGNMFGIRINCRRASRNTTGYMYIYGAEIEVDATIPEPRTVTSTLTGNGTIDPNGTYSTYQGSEYTITIIPTDKSETVTVTNNGSDVTSDIVAHGSETTETFTASDSDTYDIQSGSSYASYAVGHTAESPSSSGSSSNMYASDTGYAEYSFNITEVPSSATIESISVKCYGHRESSTTDSTHISRIALYDGSSRISDEAEFPSTSNSIISTEANSIPTSLSNLKLRHTVGYYGGLVLGITLTIIYSTGSGVDHYTYTYIVDGDATIAVTIGSSAKDSIFVKLGGLWKEVEQVFIKRNGQWIEISPSEAFDSSLKYVYGGSV